MTCTFAFLFTAAHADASLVEDITAIRYTGEISLGDFNDNSYDWGHTVIQTAQKYQMWWVHGNPHDEIFYAESVDCIHWTNVQSVMTAARSVEDVKKGRTTSDDKELMHVGRPSVVLVGNTYYMFYESPSTIDPTTFGETDNDIFMATSADGVHWNKYPDNNRPQPVIRVPQGLTGQGKYGVGQPMALYRNGKFEIFYTADTMDYKNKIYTATSENGMDWYGKNGKTGNENHDAILEGRTLDVKYSTKLNRYVAVFSERSTAYADKSIDEPLNYSLFYLSSADRYTWAANNTQSLTYSKRNNLLKGVSKPATRAFPAFVTNAQGLVDGTTFHVMFMSGEIHDLGADWRQKAATWNGALTSFNPPEYAALPVALPASFGSAQPSASPAPSAAAAAPPGGRSSSSDSSPSRAASSGPAASSALRGSASSLTASDAAAGSSARAVSSSAQASGRGPGTLLWILIPAARAVLAAGGVLYVVRMKRKGEGSE